jgi:hypothetical protein
VTAILRATIQTGATTASRAIEVPPDAEPLTPAEMVVELLRGFIDEEAKTGVLSEFPFSVSISWEDG